MYQILILLFILLIYGCASTQPSSHFVKVLGVTPTGDTILIDVNSLRPKIYNNYYRHYDNNLLRPYFYNPPVIIRPSNTNSNRPVVMPSTSNPPLSKPSKGLVKDN